MKIKSNLHAGRINNSCEAEKIYLKQAIKSGNCSANSWSPSYSDYPSDPYYPTTLPSYPSYTTTPVTSTSTQVASGGGWYNGAYYNDRSGSCG
jgi:hypothetical protein